MKNMALTACVGLLVSSSIAAAAENLKEAFTEGTIKGELRTYSFTREFDKETTDRADNAFGTLLYYRTAPVWGLSAGLGYATANDLGSDDDKAVYGLLARNENGDHANFSRFQEYFLQGNWFDTTLKLGAQQIDSPFLNEHDIRLVPKTYRGLTVANTSVENLTLRAMYITDYMGWSDEEFLDMSSVAKAENPEDEALWAGSAKYALPVKPVSLVAEAWHYHMDDFFQSTFVKATVGKKIADVDLYFIPSYLKQDSIGLDLAGAFDTDQYGFAAGAKAYGFDLTGYYAKTGDDDLFVPWGDGKIIIQQVNAAGRADEDAYGLKLAYDFAAVGVKGLGAYVFHTLYDTPGMEEGGASDINETNFSVQYAFSGALDGLSLRARYAIIDYDEEPSEDYDDFRLYLKYTFAFGGKR